MSEVDITLPKWSEIEPQLKKHGIKTDDIEASQKRNIIASIFTMHLAEGGYDISVIEDSSWEEIADDLIEDSPRLGTGKKARDKLVRDLLDANENDHDGSDSFEDLAQANYAVVVQRDEDAWVLAAESDEQIAGIILGTYTGTEGYDEWVSEIYDMKKLDVISTNHVVTVTFNGVTVSSDDA